MTIPKFLEKFLEDTFKDVSKRRWYTTIYWYMIDSKERTQKRLDSFLKVQIDQPDQEVLDLALKLASKCPSKRSDNLIIDILKYVYSHVKYRYDEVNFGKVEYWATAAETLKKGFGDCDDINGCIYVLFRLASAEIMDNYCFCVIGDTPSGGHFWVIYFSPKTGKWYPIDGTYHPDLNEIGKGRKEYGFDTDKNYTNVWFYFNSSYILKQT